MKISYPYKANSRFLPVLLLAFSFFISQMALYGAASENDKEKNKSKKKYKTTQERLEELRKKKEQNKVLKDEIIGYMRENIDRSPGEGWLYLARHFFELRKPKRSLIYLRTLFRSDHVKSEIKWEGKLLQAEIFEKDKAYKEALKELDRLISWEPERSILVRAKIQRAKLLGRNLTGIENLFDAFKRYYWYFPEKNDGEAIEYMMGFQRGYDLEIAMKALEAWEEIAKFPEEDAADEANMHIAMLHAFDLSNPARSLPFLKKIRSGDTEPKTESDFVAAILKHFYLKNSSYEEAMKFYSDFRNKTKDLYGYRIAGIMQSQLALNKLNDNDAALKILETLFEVPPHLIASESISFEKREEKIKEEEDWAVLASKMAGYISEYKVKNPDRARYYYQKGSEINKKRKEKLPEEWLRNALDRTEPKISQAQMLFDMAYEKYRSRKIREALKYYENFIKKYPNHELYREALYRTSVITDDDLRKYDEALNMYQRYLIQFVPRKSTWKLDVLYDWGRIDEVRYRIGNLLALHKKDPLAALKNFKDLAEAYPDSYWAMQGLKDSVRIYQEDLGDSNKANDTMLDFIARYPESSDASKYRLKLYKIFLQKEEQVKALHILRSYLDHTLPSEKDYFKLKQQWRDLAFRIREESLRKTLEIVGPRDKVDIYQNLMDVLCLASSSAPLDQLVKEIDSSEMKDELRWGLEYKAGIRMYRFYPKKAGKLFEKLANNATGTPRLACLLTLGNIAYRVDKSISDSIKWYEQAREICSAVDPRFETPHYRLGRLYLADGDGLKGLNTLQQFIARYPRSRHLAKAYMAMGDACSTLHHPDQAVLFYRRVMRISQKLAKEAGEKVTKLKDAMKPADWLKLQADNRKKERDRIANLSDEEKEKLKEKKSIKDLQRMKKKIKAKSSEDDDEEAAEFVSDDYIDFNENELYTMFLDEHSKAKPDLDACSFFLFEILKRKGIESNLRQKALRHYISCAFFRKKSADKFVKEVQTLLSKHNYAEWQSELLYRLAQTYDFFVLDAEEANRSYFEYLSFYPQGKRVLDIRQRIPKVYEKADDIKNSIRFYQKVIDDQAVPEEIRVDVAINLAKLQITEEKKKEAIKTLEAVLIMDSERKGEICLRLEKLTDEFRYVQQALELKGDEKFRFKALKRVIKKAEDDEDFEKAGKIIDRYAKEFETPDATVWIDNKIEELSKRGVIEEIQEQIERFPEEPETAGRMFRLAKLVEGSESSKYRAQDLFYEITLVYPGSRHYQESKIRADNTRSIKAISELTDMLKKGTKDAEGEEILIERARLLREDLKDLNGAMENYESFVKLFPDSKRLDEVYLGMGDIIFTENQDSEQAIALWEKAIAKSRDPFLREEITKKINNLKLFRSRVLYSEDKSEQKKGLQQIFRIWRLERDRAYALGLLRDAIGILKNKPKVAQLRYFAGRILEELKKPDEAYKEYEKAFRSLYHPGCRKDMVLYRMARIRSHQNREKDAADLYRALVHRYPKSLLSRSGLYCMYKYSLKTKKLTRAHHYLERLLLVRALYPSHREELLKQEKELEAKMNIEEMQRLRSYSSDGGSELPYFIGKVLENDLMDYDRAISQYEEFLKTSPSTRRSREIMTKIADLYEQKGDYVKTVSYLDMLLDTYQPNAQNFDLIIRIGDLVEDKIGKPDLTNLFYSSILAEYDRIPKVRNFAREKLRRLEEKKFEEARKPRRKKKIKRVYTEDDELVIEELEEIIERQVDDLQDFKKAERLMVELWDENSESLATLDIMKTLVKLNIEQLKDPHKASEFYERWIEENPDDPLLTEYTMKLYDHYMEVVRDGDKALRLLQDYIRDHPISVDTMGIELKLAKANEVLIRNFDEARRIYQRIIDTKQNDPVVHEAYFRMGFVLRDGFANYDEAVKMWNELIDLYYNNEFADKAQFAIAFTYETYQRDYTQARANYEKILNLYPNSSLQNQARDALLRIEGK